MRMLVIDEWIPLPLESGKKIRTFQLLSPLRAGMRLPIFATPIPRPSGRKSPAWRTPGSAWSAFRLPGGSSRRPGWPWDWPAICSAAPRWPSADIIRRVFGGPCSRPWSGRSFDVVHCEWTHYAQYLKAASRVPRFLSSHNVESMQWRRLCQVQTNPLRRAAIRLECAEDAGLRAAGPRHVRRRRRGVGRRRPDHGVLLFARSVEIIPNGVDLGYYDQGGGDDGTETIVYCGSMDYFPNQDAALHFARKILPRIRGRRARSRFLVLGRSPPASIRALANDHIAVSGTVDDVRPYLLSATVSVVPLRVAGGSRLKIFESFAAGVPVVSTFHRRRGTRTAARRGVVDRRRRDRLRRGMRSSVGAAAPAGTDLADRQNAPQSQLRLAGHRSAGRGRVGADEVQLPAKNRSAAVNVLIVQLRACRFFGGPERQVLGLAAALSPQLDSAFVVFSEGGLCRSFVTEIERAGFPAVVLRRDTPRLLAARRKSSRFLRAWAPMSCAAMATRPTCWVCRPRGGWAFPPSPFPAAGPASRSASGSTRPSTAGRWAGPTRLSACRRARRPRSAGQVSARTRSR